MAIKIEEVAVGVLWIATPLVVVPVYFTGLGFVLYKVAHCLIG